MEEYADIYYVDSRNARDHRPGNRPQWQPSGSRGPAQTTVYVPQRQPVVYTQPYAPAMTPMQSSAAMLLGKLTTGEIINMVAQVFGALQSLPNAPVATRETNTDVANLILYQSALASHAKRDEQVRTLGALVAKLVG